MELKNYAIEWQAGGYVRCYKEAGTIFSIGYFVNEPERI